MREKKKIAYSTTTQTLKIHLGESDLMAATKKTVIQERYVPGSL
jgi:hypothetical protein